MSIRHLVFMLLITSFAFPSVILAQDEPEVDREYTLSSTMLGYFGIGGDIDGVRNPILRAKKGEMVKITIINGEDLIHDIVMEQAGARSAPLNEKGSSSSIFFEATDNDVYFCSIPGHRTSGMEGRFEILNPAAASIEGFPVIADSRALNMNFETGNYADWEFEGEAFGTAPVEGDVIVLRTGDTRSGHEGDFWVSSAENLGHRSKGVLSSSSFKVVHPWASFRVSGGALSGVRVELVDKAEGEVIFKTSGHNGHGLRPVLVDLSGFQDREVFVRLVDDEDGVSGLPYIRDNQLAYIGFDDFSFFSEKPSFPNEFDSSEIYTLPPILETPFSGLSPQKAVDAMRVPDGFTVSLGAGEPDVIRPIAFTYDDRGRLWVVEAHTYPEPAPEGEGKDRILIFEDTVGDGFLDSRKVFTEGLNLISGIEYGFGGIWLGAAPYLLYIPVKDDLPAGPPEIKLDGWGTHDTHEILNSFRWGPDGWLYGTHGVFTHSVVGKPGTAEEDRVKLNGGVWRYHPTKENFELWAEGTSNPWGIDFNDMGHPFITACVIPHLYHVIPGGRYIRQAYKHFNPYTYVDIDTHGDHVHFVGERNRPHSGNHRSDEVGGGHAHAGAMIYLGGSWPDEYRDKLIMNNIHGYRANVDKLVREGSGYVGKHEEDFLFANDSWSQMLNFRYGPGGSAYVIDWYDKNQCHSPNPDVHDKELGRIFKVSHENDRIVSVDLEAMSSQDLVEFQLHENDWFVRHARRLLTERGPDPNVHSSLRKILDENSDVTRRLRALWTLYVTEGLSDADLIALADDDNENVRAWSVQLLADDGNISDPVREKLASMASDENSAMVRMYIASAAQSIAPNLRWDIMNGLYSHEEDAADHNIPAMVWYAAEPMVVEDMDRALSMALDTKLKDILDFTVRRISAEGSPEALAVLSKYLSEGADTDQQKQILSGLNEMIGGTEE